ncbi:hypothetical protein D3C87_720030 [compost metagenome]
MYITKTIAEQVAKKLLEDKNKAQSEAEHNLEVYARELYEKDIPKELLFMFNKYKNKDTFQSRGSCKFSGEGIGYETYYFDYSTVSLSRGSCLKISTEEATKLLLLKKNAEEGKIKYLQLLSDVTIALVNIKTYKNCEKVFPKAFALLPSKTTTAVSVNLDKILAELN